MLYRILRILKLHIHKSCEQWAESSAKKLMSNLTPSKGSRCKNHILKCIPCLWIRLQKCNNSFHSFFFRWIIRFRSWNIHIWGNATITWLAFLAIKAKGGISNLSRVVWPHLLSTDGLSLENAHFCLKSWCQQIVFLIGLFWVA